LGPKLGEQPGLADPGFSAEGDDGSTVREAAEHGVDRIQLPLAADQLLSVLPVFPHSRFSPWNPWVEANRGDAGSETQESMSRRSASDSEDQGFPPYNRLAAAAMLTGGGPIHAHSPSQAR
jgi:hypothetical protein